MRIHFIGVGGIGMSGLTEICLERGCVVSGCDVALNRITAHLVRQGARIVAGHDARHLDEPLDLVVVSAAVPSDAPELRAARARSIRTISRGECLALLAQDRRLIAVSGAHGKTTTSGLIAQLLIEAGWDPTVVVGGIARSLGTNARSGTGRYLVAETDESDGSFLHLHPEVAIVTNIDREHLNYYHTFERLVEAFEQFVAQLEPGGILISCADDPTLRRIAEGDCSAKRPSRAAIPRPGAVAEGNPVRSAGPFGPAPGRGTTRHSVGAWDDPIVRRAFSHPAQVTYGLHPSADVMAEQIHLERGGSQFRVVYQGRPLGSWRLRIPGQHNVVNALAVIGLGLTLDISLTTIREALEHFHGTMRRFYLMQLPRDIWCVEDYAHHPSEIQATLAADAEHDRYRLVVFQPHRFSRTLSLERELTTCFDRADGVIVTDIYAASEPPIPGISGERLATLIKDQGHPWVRYVPAGELTSYVSQIARPGNTIFFLGAGDIGQMCHVVADQLRARARIAC